MDCLRCTLEIIVSRLAWEERGVFAASAISTGEVLAQARRLSNLTTWPPLDWPVMLGCYGNQPQKGEGDVERERERSGEMFGERQIHQTFQPVIFCRAKMFAWKNLVCLQLLGSCYLQPHSGGDLGGGWKRADGEHIHSATVLQTNLRLPNWTHFSCCCLLLIGSMLWHQWTCINYQTVWSNKRTTSQ